MCILKIKRNTTILLTILSYILLTNSITYTHSANIDNKCQYIDGEYLYDFSDLFKQDYFEYVENTHDHKVKFYLSLCHPLQNVPDVCKDSTNKTSGVCISKLIETKENNTTVQTKEEPIASFAGGIPKTGFTHENTWMRYIYEPQGECNDGIKGKINKYQVSINFICPTHSSLGLGLYNEQEYASPILMSSNNCVYNFAWMTASACQRKVVSEEVKKCILPFSNSSELLNLHHLHSQSYYNVSNKYLINICGPITDFSCGGGINTSICDISDINNPLPVASTEDMELSWKDKNNKMLLLKYDKGVTPVTIQFVCKTTAHKPLISLFSNTDSKEKRIIFNVATSTTCEPKFIKCTFHDYRGNSYDLNTLRNNHSNWEVMNYNSESDEFTHVYSSFLLNMCGPLHEEYGVDCGGGAVGACEVEYSNAISKNLGLITSDPVVNDDGSITVIYTGGDQCADTRFSRSTIITLYCSETDNVPTFIEMTETCQYIFTWHTPAACPRHVVKGENCLVKDSRYGHTFDLNPLRNATKDYRTSDGEHDYMINVCGPLLSPCGELAGTENICQVEGEDQHSGGKGPGDLKYNDGTITIKYQDGSGECNGGNRTSEILFICDHNGKNSTPRFFLESPPCFYTFIWHTIHACPPHTIINCKVHNKTHIYDLTKLSRSNMNEEYFSINHKTKYVLNVCRSVVHSKSSPCSFNAGACVIDKEHKEEPVNIGEVEEGPQLENGVLKLHYKNGDVCNDTHRFETLIVFKCDDHDLLPQLISEEHCKYVFSWTTPYACPQEIETEKEEEGNCTVVNPYTKYVYNLSSLRKESGYTANQHTYDIVSFNVCGKLSDSHCQGSGACAFKDSEQKYINVGSGNSNLKFRTGSLFLEYKNGDICKDGAHWTTHISFICPSQNSSQNKPFLIDINKYACTFFISMYTELACEHRIDCHVDTGEHVLDFTHLIKTNDNYEIINPENTSEKFYINVCRTLNPILGVNCPPGSAACRDLITSEELPQSLGHPIIAPQYLTGEGSVLLYTLGSRCPSKLLTRLTSRFTFKCDDEAGDGHPVLTKTTECQYRFEWKTIHACPPKQYFPNQGLQCQIRFDEAKTNVDLSPLNKPGGYKVTYVDRTFIVNVCGKACNDGSGTCTTDHISYGMAESSELKWDSGKLTLIYYNGKPCSDTLSNSMTTSIFFTCDMSAGYGSPVPDSVMSELSCMAVFDWRTNVTCIEGIYNDHTEASTTTHAVVHTTPTTTTTSDTEATSTVPSSPAQAVAASSITETSHSLTAVFVTLLFMVALAIVVAVFIFKSSRGHRIFMRMKSVFQNSGPTVFLLDDQQL